MSDIINMAAYRFASLGDLKKLRDRLLAQCRAWNLKGTILLSLEGINLFVAGAPAEIEKLLAELRAIPGLETLQPKFSPSTDQPFNRMLVRIKKEIIAFGIDGIRPAEKTSRKLSPQTLRQWLDEGRPITLLDTRNDYEVKLGTFKNAQVLDIHHFRQFPDAVRQLPLDLKTQPVVMFCTGGIRCEKAGPYMEREGYRDVFQLEGGILKYFEECGGAHYQGECFVFDQRVGVDPALQETDTVQCYKCLTPLTESDRRDSRYIVNETCPYCFQTSAQKKAAILHARHEQIHAATHPLPGSTPYDNRKPVIVSPPWNGAPLLDFLGGILPHIPREKWADLCATGHWLDAQNQPQPATRRVKTGERYYLLQPGIVEPDVNPAIRLLYEDEALLVINKPAPLPLHPSGRFNRNTLQHILHHVYAPQKPRPAHRLDADTTGVVLWTRTRHFAGLVQPQFARQEVEKTYLVQVLGHPAWESHDCAIPLRAETDDTGKRGTDPHGFPAKTEFKVIDRRSDGTALLQARLSTGRTNQIRLHLAELGHPVLGEKACLPGAQREVVQTLELSDPPLRLHAWKLTFTHPLSGERMTFTAEPPYAG